MLWLIVGLLVFLGVFISGIVEISKNVTIGLLLMIPSGFFIIVLIASLIINYRNNNPVTNNSETQNEEFDKLSRFEKGSYFLALKQLDTAMNHYTIGSSTDSRCKEMVNAYYRCPFKNNEAIIEYLMEVGYNIMKRDHML